MLKIDGKIYNRSASEPIPSIVRLIAILFIKITRKLMMAWLIIE